MKFNDINLIQPLCFWTLFILFTCYINLTYFKLAGDMSISLIIAAIEQICYYLNTTKCNSLYLLSPSLGIMCKYELF
jgi:hypothetical protein